MLYKFSTYLLTYLQDVSARGASAWGTSRGLERSSSDVKNIALMLATQVMVEMMQEVQSIHDRAAETE